MKLFHKKRLFLQERDINVTQNFFSSKICQITAAHGLSENPSQVRSPDLKPDTSKSPVSVVEVRNTVQILMSIKF